MLLRKDRNGVTGMVDAMIFITIMTLVFTAMYTINLNNNDDDRDASELVDTLLLSKFKLNDIMNTDDSKVISMTDLMAASAINKNTELPEYLTSILDSVTGNPDSYHMKITYRDNTFSVGKIHNVARSSNYTESQSTYGDMVCISLDLY